MYLELNEWYWVVLIVVGFIGIVVALAYMGSKGVLNKQAMNVITALAGGATSITHAVAGATENTAIDIMDLVMTLVDKSVLAAENAFYNGYIDAEDRKHLCMTQFADLLNAAGITLTKAQMDVVETLIAASCEALGHGNVEFVEEREKEVEREEALAEHGGAVDGGAVHGAVVDGETVAVG